MKIVQARSEAINNWVWSTFASTQCTKPMSAYLCQPLVSRSLVVNAGTIVVHEAEFRVYATLASNTDPQHTAQQFTTLPSKPSQPCSALLAQHCSTPLKPSAQQLGCIIFTLLPVPRAPHCGRARSHLWSTFQTSPSPISPV